jgi:hypothetical protein
LRVFHGVYCTVQCTTVKALYVVSRYVRTAKYFNKKKLKGQCHEIVVEIKPWSGRLGLNKRSRALFFAKNHTSQSYNPYSSTSIYVKSGSPDPADFAMTRHLIHWQVLALHAMVGLTIGKLWP